MTTIEWIILLLMIVLVLFVGLIAYICIVVIARADRQMDVEYIEWLKNKDKQPEADEKAKKEAERRKHNKSLIDKEQEDMDKAVREFISRGGLPR